MVLVFACVTGGSRRTLELIGGTHDTVIRLLQDLEWTMELLSEGGRTLEPREHFGLIKGVRCGAIIVVMLEGLKMVRHPDEPY